MSDVSKTMDRLYRQALQALIRPSDSLGQIATAWSHLRDYFLDLSSHSTLSEEVADGAHRYAHNLITLATSVKESEKYASNDLEELYAELAAVLKSSSKEFRDDSDRQRQTVSRVPHDGKTVVHHPSKESTENEHLRLWFLDHLSAPYPTPNEKASLITLTGFSRNKIDSDMTNWRRRAGWTEIKDRYARGSREAMKTLIEKVESGQEKRQAVLDAVEGMRAYLERREDEKVGDWVHELTNLAQPAKRAKKSDGSARPISPHDEMLEIDHDLDTDSPSSLNGQSSYGSLSAASNAAPARPRTRARSSRSKTSTRSVSSSSNWSASSDLGHTFSLSPSTQRNTSGVSDISFNLDTSLGSKQGMKRGISEEMETEEERPAHPSYRVKSDTSASVDQVSEWLTPPSTVSPSEYANGYAQQYFPAVNTQAPIIPYQSIDASVTTSIPLMSNATPSTTLSPQGSSFSSVWSTDTPLPVLPHMAAGSVNNGFAMPGNWNFQPHFGGYSS